MLKLYRSGIGQILAVQVLCFGGNPNAVSWYHMPTAGLPARLRLLQRIRSERPNRWTARRVYLVWGTYHGTSKTQRRGTHQARYGTRSSQYFAQEFGACPPVCFLLVIYFPHQTWLSQYITSYCRLHYNYVPRTYVGTYPLPPYLTCTYCAAVRRFRGKGKDP